MPEKLNALGNIELDKKQGYALLSLNPRMYSLDAVLSVAGKFMGKSCVMLDGNPKEEILVELRPKGRGNIEKLAFDFNRELVKSLGKQKKKKR